MSRVRNVVAALVATALVAAAFAQPVQDTPPKEPPAKPTHPALENLKSLAGEWFQADDPSRDTGERKDTQPACIYKVVSAGSAVQETLFPGTPHEMVTMYHLDGDNLVLTHYCALANQPRMKAEKSDDPSKLIFKFAGGTNVDPAKDQHMHDLTITFLDADHFRAEWVLHDGGKQKDVKTFQFYRKRK